VFHKNETDSKPHNKENKENKNLNKWKKIKNKLKNNLLKSFFNKKENILKWINLQILYIK
jgi:hypothetical protein